MDKASKSKRKSKSKRRSKPKLNTSPNDIAVDTTPVEDDPNMETDVASITDCIKEPQSNLKSSENGSETSSVPEKIVCKNKPVVKSRPEVTLRWTGQLDDPDEESRRIEIYKTRRRERYRQAAAEAASNHQLTNSKVNNKPVNVRIPSIYSSTYSPPKLSEFYRLSKVSSMV